MAFNKGPTKADVVNDIIEVLHVEKNEVSEFSENLNKMSKKVVSWLFHYLVELAKSESDKPEPAPHRVSRAFPKLFMPHDVPVGIRRPPEMNDMLAMLPEIGRVIFKSFMEGDFPELKRAIGVNTRITGECEKMVSRQLWDAIKVVTENDLTAGTTDDPTT